MAIPTTEKITAESLASSGLTFPTADPAYVERTGEVPDDPLGTKKGGVESNKDDVPSGSPGTVFRYTNPVTQEVEGLDRTAPTEQEQSTIRESARADMQAYIDAVNKQFQGLIREENLRGEQRSGETRSGSARAGLLGSSFGGQRAERTGQFNKEQVAAIEAQRGATLEKAYDKIRTIADQKIESEKAYAQKNQELYMNYQQAAQKDSREVLRELAQGGLNVEDMDPQAWSDLVQGTGYGDEQMAKLIFNANKPKAEQIDYQYIQQADGSILAIGQDPKTGALVRETIEGVGPEVGIVIDMIKQYPDAGILPSDDIGAASEKIRNSPQYQASLDATNRSNRPSAPASERPRTYQQRLEEEIDFVYGGRYGTDQAREKALAILQREFPDKDVSSDIYSKIPDGYEKQVGTAAGVVRTEDQASEEETKKLLNQYGINSLDDLENKRDSIPIVDYQRILNFILQ